MIPERYKNGTAILIATGPSLTAEQVTLAVGARASGIVHALMGVNDAYRACADLDLLYAADCKWIAHHDKHIYPRLRCNQRLWTVDDQAPIHFPNWTHIPGKAAYNLSLDRGFIHHGCHSGFQLINVAYLMGLKTLILIGYDAHSGGRHFFGPHRAPELQVKSNYDRWLEFYDRIDVSDLTVINATPGSAIKAFPTSTLEELLDAYRYRAASRA